MKDKRAARIAYYEGVRRAALTEFKATEDGLRKLQDVDPRKIEKVVADVHKRHARLLGRIDRQIREEKAWAE